jgi:alkylation response protein AidB-like acyl-CoA dehydrogenase
MPEGQQIEYSRVTFRDQDAGTRTQMLQIYEGTNQIQRMVMARQLLK